MCASRVPPGTMGLIVCTCSRPSDATVPDAPVHSLTSFAFRLAFLVDACCYHDKTPRRKMQQLSPSLDPTLSIPTCTSPLHRFFSTVSSTCARYFVLSNLFNSRSPFPLASKPLTTRFATHVPRWRWIAKRQIASVPPRWVSIAPTPIQQ